MVGARVRTTNVGKIGRTIIGLLVIVAVSAGFPAGASAATVNQGSDVWQEIQAFVAEHPETKQVNENTVQVSENHFVVFSDVQSRTPAVAQASCPSDAYCWFEHSYYGGNIEWYRGHVGNGCGYTLGVFRILDGKASSWWNNSHISIGVIGGLFGRIIYTLTPINSNPYVGDGNNDNNDYYCG
jgi:Peptidase inhibitor family I36